jgi:hypothetical protein
MPVKVRVAKALRPVFSDEAVELFAELERARQNPRTHPKFQDKSRQLARMLGLIDEWVCAVCHVNDGSSESGYPPGHLTDVAFWRVREVRKQLLAAADAQKEKSLAN